MGSWISRVVIVLIMAGVMVIAAPHAGNAEITTTFEVQESYEDNVIGLVRDNQNITGAAVDVRGGGGGGGGGLLAKGLDDPGTGPTTTATGGEVKKADYSTTIHADIVSRTVLNDSTALLFQIGAEYTAYQKFKSLDFLIAQAKAGIAYNFTHDVSGKLYLTGATKDFKNDLRDSTAFGTSLQLKEKFTPFWLKQRIDLEQNHAKDSLFSYDGSSAGLRAGYDITAQSYISVGFSYLIRKYKAPAGFKVNSQTASAEWNWNFAEHWSARVGYDREMADSNVPDSATTNNIYSVGLQASF